MRKRSTTVRRTGILILVVVFGVGVILYGPNFAMIVILIVLIGLILRRRPYTRRRPPSSR